MTGKQRILLVHNYYKLPGGEDTVVENEKRLLEEHGHEVFLYTRSNRELDSMGPLGKLCLPLTALFSAKTYREVRRLILQKRIDIVQVHNTLSLISPSVYYAAFSCGVPVVQTIHNFRLLCPAATFVRAGRICEDCLKHGLFCSLKHSCYRGSRLQTLVSAAVLKLHRLLGTYRRLYYICLTEFNREKLLSLNQRGKERIRAERVFVKPNFAWDPAGWTGGAEKIPRKDQYIYAARLEKLKGIRTLLEAWRELPDKPLIICGSGPEEEWVRRYVEENRMTQVRLAGQLPHDQVLRLLAESRALILPTLWYEGQPMSILESYAVGTPVLASDLGNAGAMVLPGVTGFRFPPGSPEGLREAVEQVEQAAGLDPRSVFESRYTPEKNYRILKDIYDYMERKEGSHV